MRHTFKSCLLIGFMLLALVLAACTSAQPEAAPQQEAEPNVEEAKQEEGKTEPEEEVAAEEESDAYTTIYGDRLPDDAVPYDMQEVAFVCNVTGNETTFDFSVAVYNRICMDTSKMSDLFQDQLVDLDPNFNVIPASAESWEVSEDGLTWTFHLKPGLQWSDGTPLTAYDWEATYQFAADPEHAWDFAWFYSGVLKNWDQVVAGEVEPSELGVKAVDDLTLQFTTENPLPPLPAMMEFSYLLQKKALEEHGPLYNSNIETAVSAGPFMLDVFKPGERVELVANPHYKGYRKPLVKRLIGIYMDPNTQFIAFQNHEVDYNNANWLSPADIEIIQADPALKENYMQHYGDFRTDYLLFDTFNPPFDDINVRKAFAKAVDREAIVENVYGSIKAIPAHSFLMPGFPASDKKGDLKELQTFDCEAAKQHLADAGYPNGEGFPDLEMWLRNESTAIQAVYQAVGASIRECLNINVEVSNKDSKAYMEALNTRPTQLQFGGVSYGMDYMDPSNMLGIWVSTGRHSWKNDEFDALIKEASSMTGDPVKREEMFKQAEQMLVDDVGAVFIAHRVAGELAQPYLAGSFRDPDSQGFTGFHWGNDHYWDSVYVTKDVLEYNTFRTQ